MGAINLLLIGAGEERRLEIIVAVAVIAFLSHRRLNLVLEMTEIHTLLGFEV